MKMQFDSIIVNDGNKGGIGLKPFEPIDLEHSNYKEWLIDYDVTKYLYRGRFPLTENDIIENFVKIDRKEKIEWAIYRLQELRDSSGQKAKKCIHIGNISLENLNFLDSNAEIIIMIGEKDFWGKGYGTLAFGCAITYGFERLGLHRLYAGTHEDNKSMESIFKNNGMQLEGKKRESYKRNGRYYNTIHYSILEQDYLA